jgi:plastocyanin
MIRFVRRFSGGRASVRVARDMRGLPGQEGDFVKRLLFLVAPSLVAMLFLVSSVGEDLNNSAVAAPKQPTRTVLIKGFSFKPANITIKPGTKVIWINKDSTPHTATADNGAFDSGILRKGQRFSRTFNRAGKKYSYHCAPHPHMRGSITVKR